MSDQPEKTNRPGPDDLPQTENLRSIFVVIDGVIDTTIRPIDSPILKQIRPDQPPEGPKPDAR